MCGEANFDVAQTFPTSQLSKRHRQKLFPTGEPTHTAIPIIATNVTAKVVVIDEGKDL
jgi:hypothetical protein